MPYPKSGESQRNYLARFMGSGEAQNSFPDAKQRAAVAYSEYRRRKRRKNGSQKA